MDPVPCPCSFADHLTTHARDLAEAAEVARRHHARAAQAEAADACQPDTVGDVGFASLDLFDVLGVHQDGRDAGLLEGFERSFPIDTGTLHHRSTHPVLLQPLDEFADAGGKGAELPGLDVCVLSGPRDPHGRRDLYLVNVKARCARVDDIETVIFYCVRR